MDEYGDDADFLAALESAQQPKPAARPTITQPVPQKIVRTGQSSIIVNLRQKGNPILNHIKNIPWEFGDLTADYQIGATACAFFLSLKYHRLHPEYIYSRFKVLGKKYNLRVVLALVDIDNHGPSLKELAKTCLVNDYTLILAWSSAEAGRYIESFKKFERAPPTLIEKHQSVSYQDRVTEFITTPRTLTKTNALELVSNFGSIRNAVNARPEEITLINGWGEKRSKVWSQSVTEPFRIPKILNAGRNEDELESLALGRISKVDLARARDRTGPAVPLGRVSQALHAEISVEVDETSDIESDEVRLGAMRLPERAVPAIVPRDQVRKEPSKDVHDLDDGVVAALAKLREN